jgi:hypothetical protein
MKKIIALLICFACAGCAHVSVTPAIEGVVRDAESGAVINGAKITLSHYQREAWKSEGVSAADGSFRLQSVKIWTPVPFASIRLIGKIEARKDGYEVSVSTFSNTSPIELRMKKK